MKTLLVAVVLLVPGLLWGQSSPFPNSQQYRDYVDGEAMKTPEQRAKDRAQAEKKIKETTVKFDNLPVRSWTIQSKTRRASLVAYLPAVNQIELKDGTGKTVNEFVRRFSPSDLRYVVAKVKAEGADPTDLEKQIKPEKKKTRKR